MVYGDIVLANRFYIVDMVNGHNSRSDDRYWLTVSHDEETQHEEFITKMPEMRSCYLPEWLCLIPV